MGTRGQPSRVSLHGLPCGSRGGPSDRLGLGQGPPGQLCPVTAPRARCWAKLPLSLSSPGPRGSWSSVLHRECRAESPGERSQTPKRLSPTAADSDVISPRCRQGVWGCFKCPGGSNVQPRLRDNLGPGDQGWTDHRWRAQLCQLWWGGMLRGTWKPGRVSEF